MLSSGASAACNADISACAESSSSIAQSCSRLQPVQRGCLAAAQLSQLVAKPHKVARKAAGSGLRPRAAQDGEFENFNAALERAMRAAEPQQRMFQQRQQRRRLQPLCGGFGGQSRKDAGGSFHQRVAAGIVEFEIPAAERRHHPPRQRAVRRHQRGRFVRDAAPRASRPRWRAPPSPDWAPRPRRACPCRLRSAPRYPAASTGRAIPRWRSTAASPRIPAPRGRLAQAFRESRHRGA